MASRPRHHQDGYYGGQQQAPMQNGHGRGYDQPGYGQSYDQGYEQGYDQGHVQDQRSYAPDNHYERDYDNEYDGYGQSSQAMGDSQYHAGHAPGVPQASRQPHLRDANGNGRSRGPVDAQSSQRSHDQYGSAPHHGYAGDPGSGRQPRQQPAAQKPQGYPSRQRPQEPGLQSRPNPADGRMYAQEAQRQKQAVARQRAPGMAPTSTPAGANGDFHAPSSTTQSYEHRKPSMEEWKAQARANMHEDGQFPDTVPQDNAFPTFGKYESISRNRSAHSAARYRGSEDSARPSTAGGNGRPTTSRDRPTLDHKPRSYNTAVQSEAGPPRMAAQAPVSSQKNQYPSPYSDPYAVDPRQDEYRAQQPQQHPPGEHLDRMQGPPRLPPAQTHHPRPAPPPHQQPPRAPFSQHQPMSSANLPARPSTSHAAQSTRAPPMAAPLAQEPQDQPYAGSAARPPKPWTEPPKRAGSLDDLSYRYRADRGPAPAIAPARTREDEIEAEMPDFDSAAPGGISQLHQRVQPQQTAAGQTSSRSERTHNYSPQRGPVPNPPQSNGGHGQGFAFDVPGNRASPESYGGAYQPESRDQYHPGAAARPPVANEPPSRRPMGDGRPMPLRQGPPPPQHQYRGEPSGPMPGGPMPPHMRPNMSQRPPQNRRPTLEQHRTDTAPPGRHGTRGPPGQGFGPEPPGHGKPGPPRNPERQRRRSNPDALPAHPTPVRPGLAGGGEGSSSRPPAARNHDGAAPSQPSQAGGPQSASRDSMSQPVTAAELEQLRRAVAANPNNARQALRLAKKLVEASTVLVPQHGDRKSAANDAERYVLEGHKIVKRLVGQGMAEAQFYLADCYSQGGLGLEPDPREAFNLYQAAAKGGHAEAAYRTAVCCEMGAEDGGGTRRDYPKALQWYRRAATLGDASGMYKLGMILLKGLLGHPKNVNEAATWLQRAAAQAEQDNPRALHELALLLESATAHPEVRSTLPADDAHACTLFQRAADWGHRGAQLRLAQAFEYGQLALPVDHRRALTWYTRAAAQGEHRAELALSGWYLTGAAGLLAPSPTEAYLWARKAASADPPLAPAMFAMGYFTETGIGCPAHLDEAKKWYGRAAAHKFPKATERLDELRRHPPGKNARPAPANRSISRRNQRRDETECVVM